MSIATLKKKTQAKYNNMSVSQSQFSLNGTLRNQGYIGQTSLSRSFVHTPMLGNTVKGHGGLNGVYKQAPVILEASLFTTNDPKQVKHSVGNNAGDIAVQNRFLSCREWPCSNPVVKNLEYSAEDYITEVKKKALKCEEEMFVPQGSIYGTELVKNGNFNNPVIAANQEYVSWINWSLTGDCGLAKSASSSWVVKPVPNSPSQVAWFNTYYSGNSIYQDIYFPATGGYRITFWTALQSAPRRNLSQTMTLTLGSVINQIIYYYTTPDWTQYTIPFFIKTPTTLRLQFLNTLNMSNNVGLTISGISIFSTDAPCCKLSDSGLPKKMFSKTKTNTTTKVITNMNGSIKYNGNYADYLARIDNACNTKTKLIVNTNRGPIY